MRPLGMVVLAVLATCGVRGGGDDVVFRETLPDGGRVEVTRSTRVEQRDAPGEGVELPPGMVFAAGRYRVDDYALRLGGATGPPAVVWRHEVASPFAEQGDRFRTPFVVHAVTLHDGEAWILFSDGPELAAAVAPVAAEPGRAQEVALSHLAPDAVRGGRIEPSAEAMVVSVEAAAMPALAWTLRRDDTGRLVALQR